MFGETQPSWFGRNPGGEKSQDPKLGHMLPEGTSIHKHLLCVRNHGRDFKC